MNIQALRHKELARLRRKIERESVPRLQMLLIVSIAAGAGFVTSALLLDTGLTQMWLRYGLAVVAAYGIFLFLLWLWLRSSAEDYVDAPQLPGNGGPRDHHCTPSSDGKGGEFGGGGAQGSYDSGNSSFSPSYETVDSPNAVGDMPIGDALEVAGQAEEFAIPLVVLILLGAMLFSSAFIIYSAPALFAELLLDAALAAGLYRKLRRLESRHWLETAIRRTRWAFIMTALMISASGWGMQVYAPEAHSIGGVIAHAGKSVN